MTLVQWATHSTNVLCKAAEKLVEFQTLQTQAEQLHSADQAAIVIGGAEVRSKPTAVSGKVRAVSQ